MGKILSTTYQDTVEKVTGFYNDLVNNPFYVINDKKPVLCTYYNINKEYSSLDPGSKLQFSNMGQDSPLRYNKVENMILYGFNRVELNTDNGEFGLEADKIEGDCYILPNTIVPTEGDYFKVDHITDSTWLFIVKDVQKDTLDNGSNAYRISYKLEYHDNTEIQEKVVNNFTMIDDIEGTNIAKVVRCEDYDIALLLDEAAVMLKKYYEELFYNEKVQTFTYMDCTEYRTYDPYMIEFLIRNKILDNGDESYIYVTHQLQVPTTFSIDYNHTFFRAFEKCDKDKILTYNYSTYLQPITSFGTTFASRFETYFRAIYEDDIKPGFNKPCIDEDLIINISEGQLYEDDENLWRNIIIKYFTGDDYTLEEIASISEINFKIDVDFFYIIPLLIFCLEKNIYKVLK